MATKLNIASLSLAQLKELRSDIETLLAADTKREQEAKLRADLARLSEISSHIQNLLEEASVIIDKNPSLDEFSIDVGEFTHTYEANNGWTSSYN